MLPVTNKFKQILKGTVIKRIWRQILLVTIYTIVVVAIYTSVPAFRNVELRLDLADILGIVTGLLLVFRTQIAYDRYWEGRNLWSSLGATIGNLARLVWISVKEHEVQDVVEKKTMMNLLSAFPLATKHYLRDEYSHEFEDMKEYLSAFPETLTKPPAVHLKGMKNGNGGGKKELIPDFVAPSNAPSEITYCIGAYLDRVTEREIVDQHVMKIMQESVSMLGDYLAGFEKILRTPMPLAYSMHLEHCLYIYILALPFQLVHALAWVTVPVVIIACFAILGILGIGGEIENPFGYDDNDLPLDGFCKDIINELRLITSLKLPKKEEWMISETNFPCGSTFGMSAQEITNTKTIEEAKEIFREHARLNPPKILGNGKLKPIIGNENPIILVTQHLNAADAEP